jgi:hypothetical protein
VARRAEAAAAPQSRQAFKVSRRSEPAAVPTGSTGRFPQVAIGFSAVARRCADAPWLEVSRTLLAVRRACRRREPQQLRRIVGRPAVAIVAVCRHAALLPIRPHRV